MKKAIWPLVLVLPSAVAVLLRLAIYLLTEPSLAGDGVGYLNRAIFIASHGTLPPLSLQPIGYSLLLSKIAFVGKTRLPYAAVRLNQAAELALLCSLLLFALRRARQILSLQKRAFFLSAAAFLILMQPFTAKLSNTLYTETIVMTLCFFGVAGLAFILANKICNTLTSAVIFVGSALCLGIASTMRLDIMAINLVMLLTAAIPALIHRNCVQAKKLFLYSIAFLLVPLSLLSAQYASSGELGFSAIGKRVYPHDFIEWTGTWRADRKEHANFAFFGSGIDNLNVNNYPAKAFSSQREKETINDLFMSWKANGYNREVAAKFKDVIKAKRSREPLNQYIAYPLFRMYHHWINLEGAEFFTVPLNIAPSIYSKLIVAITFAMRLILVSLFLYGLASALSRVRSLFAIKISTATPALRITGCDDVMYNLSLAFVLLRTAEFGMASMLPSGGGLMEPRYMVPAFPFLILVAIDSFAGILGFDWIGRRSMGRLPSAKAS